MGRMAAPRTAAVVALSRVVELAVDEVDLSVAQYRILGYCARGPTTPGDVARWLSVRKQNITRQIESLVGAGYLVRDVDVDDRRRVVLHLTRSGRAILRAGDRAIDRSIEGVLALLPAKDSAAADRGLEALDTALREGWARARADR